MSVTAHRSSVDKRPLSLRRPGAIAVLTAIVLVVLLMCVAVAIDIGAIVLVRTQLQSASDSAALAAATQLGYGQAAVAAEATSYANHNKQLGGSSAEIDPSEVNIGVWDRTTQTFTTADHGNAVRVTTRGTNHGYFFAKMAGPQTFSSGATAIASAVPRDIILVVDLSGSMNSDTEPAWSANAIEGQSGVPAGTGEALLSTLYTDLYGGISGSDFNLADFVTNNGFELAAPEYAYAVLTMNEGPLSTHPNTNYKINPGDGEATRKAKAFRWFREQIIGGQMSGANPPITQTAYWDHYLHYVLRPITHSVPPPDPPPAMPNEPQPPSPPNYGPCWCQIRPQIQIQTQIQIQIQIHLVEVVRLGLFPKAWIGTPCGKQTY